MIFPNLANEQVTISFGTAYRSNSMRLLLYDQLGRLILKDEFTDSNSRGYALTSLAEGIYFLDIQCDNQIYRTKVVITR